MPRVIVVGGGIIGLCCALALVRQGREVVILERSLVGVEASTAAAGILSPRMEADGDETSRKIGIKALQTLERWCADLPGVDIDPCGVLVVSPTAPDPDAVECEPPFLDRLAARARFRRAWLFAQEGCVDPRRLVPALHDAALAAGVRVRTGVVVERVQPDGVVLSDGRVMKGEPVVCGGAWSGGVQPLAAMPVRPMRGQLVALDVRDAVRSVIFGAGGYIVPRRDETVVGTTLEDVGFTRGVTAAGMDHVLEVAQSLVRGLATAPLVRHWSSFRPSTPDGRPIVGKIGGIWVATGHHRNGILLSAHTAELLAAAMCEAVALPALWSPQRFEGVPA